METYANLPEEVTDLMTKCAEAFKSSIDFQVIEGTACYAMMLAVDVKYRGWKDEEGNTIGVKLK